jgi:hypothetical protein
LLVLVPMLDDYPVPVLRRLRQAIALPLYTVALVYTAAALGRLAAVVAGDDWPG